MQQITDKQEKEQIIAAMRAAGLHYGHKKSRLCPKMREFIKEDNNDLLTIDLEKTWQKLDIALEFIKKVVAANGSILLVGTMPSAKKIIKETAEKYNFPYINERWLGGLITNFKTILQRINYLSELSAKKTSGEWEKYTKKERLKLEEELLKLEKKFGGLKHFSKLPEAIFIVDTGAHSLVVKEAKKMKIPVIGILDTDDDPVLIDYPIPANDSAKSSIDYLLGKVGEAIEEGKKIEERGKNKI